MRTRFLKCFTKPVWVGDSKSWEKSRQITKVSNCETERIGSLPEDMYDQACAPIPGWQSAIFCFPDISGKFKFCQKLNSDWSISETTPSIHEHRMSQNLGRLGQLLVSVGGASNSMVEYFDGKTWTDQAWGSNLIKILQKKFKKFIRKPNWRVI